MQVLQDRYLILVLESINVLLTSARGSLKLHAFTPACAGHFDAVLHSYDVLVEKYEPLPDLNSLKQSLSDTEGSEMVNP